MGKIYVHKTGTLEISEDGSYNWTPKPLPPGKTQVTEKITGGKITTYASGKYNIYFDNGLTAKITPFDTRWQSNKTIPVYSIEYASKPKKQKVSVPKLENITKQKIHETFGKTIKLEKASSAMSAPYSLKESYSENISFDDIFDTLSSASESIVANLFAGKDVNLGKYLQISDENLLHSIQTDGELFKTALYDYFNREISKNLINEMGSKMFYKYINDYNENRENHSKLDTFFNYSGKGTGAFGTFLEKTFFGYDRNSDPRADLFEIATEVKTKQLGDSKFGNVTVGNISVIPNAKTPRSGNEAALFHTIMSTYKFFVKMRNLLLIFVKKGEGSFGGISFKEMDLFLLLQIKLLWAEIIKEVVSYFDSTQAGSSLISLKIDVTDKKGTYMHAESNVYKKIINQTGNQITYTLELKMPTDFNNADNIIDNLGWANLYLYKFNLLTRVKDPAQDDFRRTLFAFLRYQKAKWGQDM